MIIGIPLLKGYLDDGRSIYYLEEDIRRKFQKDFVIKTFIPVVDTNIDINKYIREDLDTVNGIYIPIDNDYNKIILEEAKLLNVPIYGEDNFIEKCRNREIKNNKRDKTIGVISKYIVTNDTSKVYLSDRLRKTLFLAGANINFIIPVQDIDYPTTRGNEFSEFTNEEKLLIDNIFKDIDGFLLPGGFKLTPYDRYLFEEAVNKDIPTLGICLGMQTMSCYKDDISLVDIDSYINHKQDNDNELTHSVVINDNSILYRILNIGKFMVNSFHKKMITPNIYFDSIAFSDDNIIEAIEMPNKRFILGLQWHPEISYEFDINSKKVIDYYISLL